MEIRFSCMFCFIFMTKCIFSTKVSNLDLSPGSAVARLLQEGYQLAVPVQADFNTTYQHNVTSDVSVSYVYNYTLLNDKVTAVRIYTTSDESSSPEFPMIVVVREERSVISWQIPLMQQYTYEYMDVSRTLCPLDSNIITIRQQQKFYVEMSTQANHTVPFTLRAEIVQDFSILTGRNHLRNVTSSPSSPVYYLYTFPDNVDSVLVTAKSTDKKCATLSIQDTKCPVFDLNKDIEYQGKYQTMTTQGFITLYKTDESSSFYIVVVVKPNDNACTDYNILSPAGGVRVREKNFTIYVEETIPSSQYYKATLAAAGVFIAFYVIAAFIGIFYHGCKANWGIVDIPRLDRSMSTEHQSGVGGAEPVDVPSGSRLLDGRQGYGAIQQQSSAPAGQLTSPVMVYSGQNDDVSVDSINSDDFDFVKDADHEKDVFRTKTALYVYDLAKKSEKRTQKNYNLYAKNLFTIAIFYGLPVIQLVMTYQKVLNFTGDQDICYYNFACARPLRTVSSFNNIYSNIGYMLLGLLFLILVARRDYLHKKAIQKSEGRHKLVGIPQYFGLFYAMGMALFMEGVMSACYHVCPSVSNFQFDTSFMYIMACLCILKIYQNRHPDISAKAHSSYLIMAIIIIVAVIGVVYGNNIFWVIFAIVYMTSSLVLSVHIYYMGRWKLDRYIFKRLWSLCLTDWCKCTRPIYLNRMILLVLGNIVNWSLAIYGVLTDHIAFATFLLSIFIGNLMLYIMFYIISKILAKEKIPLLTKIFILMSTVTWGFSLYFFTRNLTNWQETPAGSRQGNHECILFDFYDAHDVWHFLSAISLFFSFLVILTLDDEIIFTRRDQIPVF